MRLRYLILGLAFVPALSFAQVQAPTYRASNGTQVREAQGTFCVPAPDGTGCASPKTDSNGSALTGHNSYTLANGATPATSQTVAPDTYYLALPTAFNGATVTVTFTANSGATQAAAYTSAPSVAPSFLVAAGTSVVASITGGVPTGGTFLNGGPSGGSGASPQATYSVTPAASSTPLIGSFTTTSVTPTSGAATFASGTATIGPLTPILGRDIVLTVQGAGPFSCQLLNSRDGGVTKYPLTIFDTQIGGPYTSPVNSAITSESVAGTTEWLICTGTGSYRVEQ